MAVLGRYLNHLAFLDKGISNDAREMARIGADVIAASMQYDQIARWALDGYGSAQHEPLPLGVFSMTRSSIYGLHYLDNMDNVKTSEKLTNQGNYRRKMAEPMGKK